VILLTYFGAPNGQRLASNRIENGQKSSLVRIPKHDEWRASTSAADLAEKCDYFLLKAT